MDEKLERLINAYNNAIDEAEKAKSDIFHLLETDYGYDSSTDGEDFDYFEAEPYIAAIDIDEVKQFIEEINNGTRE